jgi:hypothetical protein
LLKLASELGDLPSFHSVKRFIWTTDPSEFWKHAVKTIQILNLIPSILPRSQGVTGINCLPWPVPTKFVIQLAWNCVRLQSQKPNEFRTDTSTYIYTSTYIFIHLLSLFSIHTIRT